MTSASPNRAATSLAATRWPWWIGSKVPPMIPSRRGCADAVTSGDLTVGLDEVCAEKTWRRSTAVITVLHTGDVQDGVRWVRSSGPARDSYGSETLSERRPLPTWVNTWLPDVWTP